MTDYDRGFAFGRQLIAEREAGGNPDPRWDIAAEARNNREGFKEFMRGLNDSHKEEA